MGNVDGYFYVRVGKLGLKGLQLPAIAHMELGESPGLIIVPTWPLCLGWWGMSRRPSRRECCTSNRGLGRIRVGFHCVTDGGQEEGGEEGTVPTPKGTESTKEGPTRTGRQSSVHIGAGTRPPALRPWRV